MLWRRGAFQAAFSGGASIPSPEVQYQRYVDALVKLKELEAETLRAEEARRTLQAPYELQKKKAEAEIQTEELEKKRQLRPTELERAAAEVAKIRAEAGKIGKDVEHQAALLQFDRDKLAETRRLASLQALSDMQKSYRAEINKTLSEAEANNPDILRIIVARKPLDAFAGYGKNLSMALADIAEYRKTGRLPDDILTDREREALAKLTPTTAAQPKATTAAQPAVEAKPSLAERFLGATTKWAREDSDKKTKELSAYMQMGGYDDKQIITALEKYKDDPKQLDVDLNIARQRHKNIEELLNLAESVTGKKLDTATKAAEYRRFWDNPDLITQYMEELRRRRR